ncbi:hypothetical protein ACFYU5_34910 [Nocardia aobensis]|uniref:Uncharacterized protein n=1 Tax=Nocardia aobensis TaxID=257277 RepID=A0ABW6PEK9_9NOCA
MTNSTGGNTREFGICKPTRARRRNRDRAWFARHPAATEYTRALSAAERLTLTAALGVAAVHGVVEVRRDGRRVFTGSFALGGGR